MMYTLLSHAEMYFRKQGRQYCLSHHHFYSQIVITLNLLENTPEPQKNPKTEWLDVMWQIQW